MCFARHIDQLLRQAYPVYQHFLSGCRSVLYPTSLKERVLILTTNTEFSEREEFFTDDRMAAAIFVCFVIMMKPGS